MGYKDSLQEILTKDFSEADEETRQKTAEDLIDVCSIACAALALQPIPLLELAIMPVQAGMVVGLGHIYGHSITRKRATEIITEIAGAVGLTIVARQTMLILSKLILPGLGGFVEAPYIFGVTRGMGKAAIHYFQHADLDLAQISNIFKRAQKEGETSFDASRVEEEAEQQKQELEKDTVSRLQQLKDLREKGLISEEEYATKRAEILAAI